ncbi:MAG: nicotinate (nicotinamide) nucleotide adenylyltransferase [Candidatus Cyclobacteriaceae bacterium M2_1C_046]
MNVGLLFGSFNPIHTGHLIIANLIKEQTDLQQVWFVVSPQNPFKKRSSLLHEFDRLDMVRAAVFDNYDLRECDIEFNMPRPSYTVDTLAYLSEKYPDHHFKLIMGEDNLKHLHKWKNYEVILENYGILVYPRPDNSEDKKLDHPNIELVKAPVLDISATFIRNCVKNNISLRYLVPDPVEELIRTKKFYQ